MKGKNAAGDQVVYGSLSPSMEAWPGPVIEVDLVSKSEANSRGRLTWQALLSPLPRRAGLWSTTLTAFDTQQHVITTVVNASHF
jgi:hypothetical protein